MTDGWREEFSTPLSASYWLSLLVIMLGSLRLAAPTPALWANGYPLGLALIIVGVLGLLLNSKHRHEAVTAAREVDQ